LTDMYYFSLNFTDTPNLLIIGL